MTYIHTVKVDCCYLASVLDLHSKKLFIPFHRRWQRIWWFKLQ